MAAQKGFNAWGLDASTTAISEAREAAQTAGVANQTHFIVGDALELPYEEHFFDAIIDGGLFHHILPENRSLYFDNTLKILKPDGLMYLTVFAVETKTTIGFQFTKAGIETLFGPHFSVLGYQKDDITPDVSFITMHFILQRRLIY
jgi:cyclopropane fatty-acyl-phospholipid synthase-like methyltransferase